MQEIKNFLASPLNVTYIAFVMLGVLMVAYNVVRNSIEKRKTILTKKNKKRKKESLLDSLLNKSKYIKKQEEIYDKHFSILDMEYDSRLFTKMRLAFVFVSIMLSLHFRNALLAIPLALICVNIPTSFIERKIKKRLDLFNGQILEAFQIFITEYTTTKSVQKTIVEICPKLKNPLRKEFERLGRKLNSGEPIEECFLDFANRTQNKWTLIFSQMMITYFRNGGEFTEQLLNITKNITDEKILAESNTTELSSMRVINVVMNLLVPLVYISNLFINPDDAKVFVETPVGRGIIFGVTVASLFSLYLGKKITEA